MATVACSWNFGSPSFHPPQAYSEEGQFVAKRVSDFEKHLRGPLSLCNPRFEALQELQEVYREHAVEGWDGEHAPAIRPETVSAACAVLDRLPPELPDPEFSVEPDDGSLVLEWWSGYRRIVSVAISGQGRFSFIAMDGTDETHGMFPSDDGSLPNHLLTRIREILGPLGLHAA